MGTSSNIMWPIVVKSKQATAANGKTKVLQLHYQGEFQHNNIILENRQCMQQLPTPTLQDDVGLYNSRCLISLIPRPSVAVCTEGMGRRLMSGAGGCRIGGIL